ncbi:MAG: Unknown protein [uncultured Sulfurovum sp.]|uniref:Uncharacterized protein n=1 Tax=uncultured Sulfurovum sp. TaxID=269237 RepID=A0A6S6SAI4_9BACT|nr:MAG: Unknown protein [uncultured Sulfurovum sp.]
MPEQLNKICDLINNKESIIDEKKFKFASATLVCDVVHNIMDANQEQQQKYCQLFQDRLNLNLEELDEIKSSLNTDRSSVNEKINYIKKELNYSKYEIMEFLKILNRFVILSGCNKESYEEFELIRDKFVEEFY